MRGEGEMMMSESVSKKREDCCRVECLMISETVCQYQSRNDECRERVRCYRNRCVRRREKKNERKVRGEMMMSESVCQSRDG